MNHFSLIPQVVQTARARLGEGPCWHGDRLYWVDIYNHRVHWFDPAQFDPAQPDRSAPFFEIADVVGCVAPAGRDRLIMALRNRLAFLNLQTGAIDPILSIESEVNQPTNRLNDGKCDSAGRFWFGSMSSVEAASGCLYRYDPDGSLHVMETGLQVSNGLGWSPDDRTFYLADSPRQRIYAYDFDRAAGTLGDRRVLVDLTAESFFPDGLTIDQEGCLWVSMWDGWCVIRFAPSGQELLRVPMPVQRPTSCAFGGQDLTTLYITSASVGLSEAEIEKSFYAGDCFCVNTSIVGLPAHAFQGA